MVAIKNMDGQARVQDLFGVFYLHYRRNHYATARRLSPILAEMETDGIICCKYTREGLVLEVFISSSMRGEEITMFRSSDGDTE